MPHQQLLSEALLGHFNVMINKGDVSVPGDFPIAGETQNGWFYAIQATVTDPVTGRTFYAGDYIVWNGTDWYLITTGGGSGAVLHDNTLRGDGSAGDLLLTRGIHRAGVLAGDTTIIDPAHQMLNHGNYTVDGDWVVDGDYVEVA